MASEIERLVADGASAFVARFGHGSREPASPEERWREAIELGWPGLLVPEDRDGSGLSGRDLAALTEALGAGALPDPIPAAIAAASLLSGLDGEEASSLLARLLGGGAVVVLAASCRGQGALSGRDRAGTVQDAAAASFFLAWDPDRRRAVAVPAGAAGLDVAPTVGGGTLVSLAPAALRAEGSLVLGSGSAAREAFERAEDVLALGTAGLLVGMSRRALDLTLDYLRTRRQFGVAIGSLQALQHRAATLHVSLSAARALVREAALAMDGPRGRTACSAARARAAETAMLVAKEAVQLHGGVGFTAEYEVGHLFRRVTAVAASGGHAAAWRARFRESA